MLYSHHQSLLSEVCTQVKPCDHILWFLNVDNSLAGDYPGWSVLRVHRGHSLPAPSIFTTNLFHSLAVGAGKPLLSYSCHSPVCLTFQWMSVGYFGLLLLSDPSMPHCSPLLSSAQILMPHRSLCMGRWGGELSCLLFFFLPCVHGFWVRHLVTLSVFIWRFREISKTMLLLPSSKLILCHYILTPSMFMWGEGNDISILEKR